VLQVREVAWASDALGRGFEFKIGTEALKPEAAVAS
jgi:hypothetical protein